MKKKEVQTTFIFTDDPYENTIETCVRASNVEEALEKRKKFLLDKGWDANFYGMQLQNNIFEYDDEGHLLKEYMIKADKYGKFKKLINLHEPIKGKNR